MTDAGMDLEHLLAVAPPTGDAEHTRLLDVARAEFIEHGFRRTSVGDIARRAKVSRPTVYRRIGEKDEIVRQVVVREVVSFFAEISGQILDQGNPTDKAVEAFVLGIRECRRHPLVAALRQYEPETLTSFLTDHSTTFEPIRVTIAAALADDTLPFESALRAAEILIRLTASLLMVPSAVLPTNTDDHARWFARTYFPAIIQASTTPKPA
ncbi:TetR/AcrR family transcriptional regulator [Nocardia sp. CDC160]|uniref:TetR/AcrR family transcriptional regulator n=1 Tax=Nocardia sp. CDC160 TaxID=3112166 RepID=UPI002DBE73B0|nr:helix-turn-helix domain-containing protein [Nocardia sp. CDC160]MEC3918399.1 helix-turn-helix domain-containing protein [Nocardia sp. CDC160]MEC3919136.1 helix-turn-helix domain-containing protein [Nocardia sp. CDC160]